MAYAEAYTGSVSIDTTEISLVSGTSSLQTVTTDAQLDIVIDFSAMTATEQYEIKVKEKTRSGDSQILIMPTITLTGAQPSAFIILTPTVLHGWDVTVKKLAGTARTIVWSIRTIT